EVVAGGVDTGQEFIEFSHNPWLLGQWCDGKRDFGQSLLIDRYLIHRAAHSVPDSFSEGTFLHDGMQKSRMQTIVAEPQAKQIHAVQKNFWNPLVQSSLADVFEAVDMADGNVAVVVLKRTNQFRGRIVHISDALKIKSSILDRLDPRNRNTPAFFVLSGRGAILDFRKNIAES